MKRWFSWVLLGMGLALAGVAVVGMWIPDLTTLPKDLLGLGLAMGSVNAFVGVMELKAGQER